ncbi:MAG: SufS family cysteine desulfurase [Sandaracinaceae bacterium]
MTSAVTHPSPPPDLDVEAVRADFPALRQTVHGKPLVYLDSAATALKPQSVIDAVAHYYTHDSANIHRAVHLLSQRATAAYEDARAKVAAFLNAPSKREVVFLRGCTEGINLVAQAYARPRLAAGDRILLTELEHHSNIVPWQMVAEQTGAEIVVAPIDERGVVTLEAVDERLDERVKIVALSHVSNSLGTVLPVAAIAERAHAVGAAVVVDGAQAAPHLPVDLSTLGADFYAISGHKLYGPTGGGALWGRLELLEAMEPYQGGGDMIRSVSFDGTTYADVPAKFEAGTPDIAAAIGLGAAVDYVTGLGLDRLHHAEQALLAYGTEALRSVEGLTLVGTADDKVGVLSFLLEGAHPHDIGTIVDAEGVAIRTGHHCAQPVMEHFGVPATARASLGLYNTREDIDALVRALLRVREMFG